MDNKYKNTKWYKDWQSRREAEKAAIEEQDPYFAVKSPEEQRKSMTYINLGKIGSVARTVEKKYDQMDKFYRKYAGEPMDQVLEKARSNAAKFADDSIAEFENGNISKSGLNLRLAAAVAMDASIDIGEFVVPSTLAEGVMEVVMGAPILKSLNKGAKTESKVTKSVESISDGVTRDLAMPKVDSFNRHVGDLRDKLTEVKRHPSNRPDLYRTEADANYNDTWDTIFGAEKANLDKMQKKHGLQGTVNAISELNDTVAKSGGNLKVAAPKFRKWLRQQIADAPEINRRRSFVDETPTLVTPPVKKKS